jgi:hypothetical protein
MRDEAAAVTLLFEQGIPTLIEQGKVKDREQCPCHP